MAQIDQTRAREGSNESPWSNSQRAAICAEADRILADPSFKKSRRCVVLFRRLVEHALEGGDEGGIKERTLGIEVFGREADYDTNTDPIVRMTANEIRKRLAQYYQSSSRHHEVHVSLVPGSYLPRFNFGLSVVSPSAVSDAQVEPDVSPDAATEPAAQGESGIVTQPVESPKSPRGLRTVVTILISALILACIAFAAVNWTNWADPLRSSQYLLWAPLLKAPEPVSICVADATVPQMTRALAGDWASGMADTISGRRPPVGEADGTDMPLVPYVDAEVSARVAGWFKDHGPIVLVGAFDNVWNLALFSKLRYHVQIDPTTKDEWIEDLRNPGNREWKGSGKLLYSDSSVDYAIITRVFDKDTGTWFVAAGGLGMHATEAAGDFLTDPELSRSLPDAVRTGTQNIQIVLKTTVIGGHTGAPQILAVHTW